MFGSCIADCLAVSVGCLVTLFVEMQMTTPTAFRLAARSSGYLTKEVPAPYGAGTRPLVGSGPDPAIRPRSAIANAGNSEYPAGLKLSKS
jgi:hypothetical protein